MNKTLISPLGIMLLFSAMSLIGMDADTFSYLVNLYDEKEITRQQLINAYHDLTTKEDLQTAENALNAEGISLAVLKEQAQKEHEQFAQTFDTLVSLSKTGEITRSQLIEAYELFETEKGRVFGDKLLQTYLQKSIAQLKREEIREHSERHRTLQRNVPKSGINQRALKQTIMAQKPQGCPHRKHQPRGTNPVQEHLDKVWEIKRARQIKEFLRNREKEVNLTLSKDPSSDNKGSLGSSKQPQDKRSADSSIRARSEQGAAQENNTSTESLESLTDILDKSKAQQSDQAKLRQELDPQKSYDDDIDTDDDSESIHSEAEGEDISKEHSKSESIGSVDQIVYPQCTTDIAKKDQTTPAKKKVRFTLPSECTNSQKDRIDMLRNHGQKQPNFPVPTTEEESSSDHEELSVHLTSKGTPIFTRGNMMLNPLIEGDQFNLSIDQIDENILHAWGLKLARLIHTDSKRETALKPLIHALKQSKSPAAKLSLLIQPTAVGFTDRAKLEKLIEIA
jgi:hypothetical protein